MKMRSIITGLALAGLCLAVPQYLSAQQEQSSSTGQSDQQQMHQQAGAQHATGMRHQTPTDVNRANKIIGMDVRNQQDQKLGTIRDLVIDYQSQRVGYAVLEKHNEQGNTGKYLAVPLNVLTPSSDMRHLVLNADKNRIDTAKGFERNNLPALPLSSTEMSFWRSISEAAGAAPGSTPAEQPGQSHPSEK